MIVLVCGGRKYNDLDRVLEELDKIHADHGITMLIQGYAPGADRLAAYWAQERGIPKGGIRADWDKYGGGAGAIRNTEMLDYYKPALVVAFPGGKGTADMVRQARSRYIPVIQI